MVKDPLAAVIIVVRVRGPKSRQKEEYIVVAIKQTGILKGERVAEGGGRHRGLGCTGGCQQGWEGERGGALREFWGAAGHRCDDGHDPNVCRLWVVMYALMVTVSLGRRRGHGGGGNRHG